MSWATPTPREVAEARYARHLAFASWCLFLGILGAIGLMLAGCAGGFNASPTVGAQQMVYSAENDFAAALRIAVAYEALPPCSATQKFPCSDPATVAKVTAAAGAARASLSTAEAAVRANTNSAAITTAALQAQSDVAVFQSLAKALGSK